MQTLAYVISAIFKATTTPHTSLTLQPPQVSAETANGRLSSSNTQTCS